MFDESDVVAVEYSPGGRVPQAVGLCMQGITDEDAWGGSLKNFRVVGLNKGKCPTANFMEVGQGRHVAKP